MPAMDDPGLPAAHIVAEQPRGALAELSVPTPRPASLCREYARRIDPWWGFAFAGFLWVVMVNAMMLVATIKLCDALGYEDRSTDAKVLGDAMFVAGLAISVSTFIVWRRHRLGTKERMIREGELLEVAVVGKPFTLRRKTQTMVVLEGERVEMRCVFNRWFSPNTGDTIEVLYHPTVSHLLAFGRHGDMYSGHVRASRRR